MRVDVHQTLLNQTGADASRSEALGVKNFLKLHTCKYRKTARVFRYASFTSGADFQEPFAYDSLFKKKDFNMALQSPFFTRRDNEPTGVRHTNANPNQTPSTSTSTAPTPLNTNANANATSNPLPLATAPNASSAAPVGEGGSKLTVGPNIKLKGVEITDCDTLVVEGTVEATMDSRLMQIAAGGAFKGSAEIDIAEIHGMFEGNLTVRQKLVIYATGKVTGKIRYGKLVIEEGGQLAGEIAFGAGANSKGDAIGRLQAA